MVQNEDMTTRWLSTPELSAWVRFASVLELLPGALDGQLRRDAGLTHFDYRLLSLLSETEEHSMRMSALARLTNSTLPRLSHVVHRLEDRGLVRRAPAPDRPRSTVAHLTEAGMRTVEEAAPGHVEAVRDTVIDALTPEQVDQLREISDRLLGRLDPHGVMRPIAEQHEQGEPLDPGDA